ncbi:MAG: arsenate reductase family protein [Candidatus Rokuibacteriota bacterium]
MTAIQTQIFGFMDCQDTRKAQRFFKERGVTVHFVDLEERPAARGELRRFAEKFGAGPLIDREGARYKALGLRVAGDSPERLLERALTEPRLLRTPLVRCGGRVAVGHAPEVWREWMDTAKPGGSRRA